MCRTMSSRTGDGVISEAELDAIFLKHTTNRCCVGPPSIQAHTGDCWPSQSHSNEASQSGQRRLKNLRRVRWFKPPVNANCSVSVPTTRPNFSATSHPVRPRFMRSGVCPHIGLRAKEATKKSEATTQIMASHSDTFGVDDTPVPAPCANNRTTSDEMFVHSGDACKCALLSCTFR